MFTHGFLTIAKLWGIELRLHWSTPLGLLLSGAFWPELALGIALLIVLHELGHAFVAVRCGARVERIDILPFGGLCHFSGHLSPLAKSAVAWGGIWAQLLLLIGTVVVINIFGTPHEGVLDALAVAFTVINGMLIFTNLVPVEPLDGHEAWKLFGLLHKRYVRFDVPMGMAPPPPPSVMKSPRRSRSDVISDAEMPLEIREAMDKALRELRERR